mmetsp:Transcript_5708/g.22564  ORF Transcript_5708/g.22564 Transcript_5708/m.22564 type:complete len:278 (-) Transcript_5708:602-1435(-)
MHSPAASSGASPSARATPPSASYPPYEAGGSMAPMRSHTASAVCLLSPVMTTTLMPAARHLSIAARASGRGASWMPTTPRKVRSDSSSGVACAGFEGPASKVRAASASVRRARRSPRTSTLRMMPCRSESVSGTPACPFLLDATRVQRASTLSGAPLTKSSVRPAPPAAPPTAAASSHRTDIIFLVRLNSHTERLRYRSSQREDTYVRRAWAPSASSAPGMASKPGSPIFSASTLSAASVGSPMTVGAAPACAATSLASLHSAAHAPRRASAGRSPG